MNSRLRFIATVVCMSGGGDTRTPNLSLSLRVCVYVLQEHMVYASLFLLCPCQLKRKECLRRKISSFIQNTLHTYQHNT